MNHILCIPSPWKCIKHRNYFLPLCRVVAGFNKFHSSWLFRFCSPPVKLHPNVFLCWMKFWYSDMGCGVTEMKDGTVAAIGKSKQFEFNLGQALCRFNFPRALFAVYTCAVVSGHLHTSRCSPTGIWAHSSVTGSRWCAFHVFALLSSSLD